METRFEALGNLLKDEKEGAILVSLSAEEAVAYLKEKHNLVFSLEELNDVAAGMKKALEETSENEISESDLEMVAGGRKSVPYTVGYYLGKTVKVISTGIKIVGGIIANGW